MISIQTNYAAMVALNNLNTNENFQTQTIQQLTSGYRINNSGTTRQGWPLPMNTGTALPS